MTYRDRPEKEKLRPPPGPWAKFIEACTVISAAIWFTVLNGIYMCCNLENVEVGDERSEEETGSKAE